MANVSLSDVRDTINVSEADVPDVKLQKMVKRAEVTLELELGREIDYNDCSEAEKEFITLLAAVYAICYLTGGSALAGIGATGTAIGYIANQFGLLNDAQTRTFNSAMMVVTVIGMFLRTSTGLAIAQKVYAAACWIATAAQNALNISYGTFLALTGVGIAVIVAAAAAMWSFANSMNAATSSVQGFNATAAEVPSRARSIQRVGEPELYRRGVE